MKKIYPLLFVAAFVFGTVSSGWALWGSPTQVEGTVKSIGSNVVTITSESPGGHKIQEISLEVNDQTKFDQIASLNELKEGDKIEVRYKEDGAKKIAIQVSRGETNSFSERMNKKDGG